MLVGIGRRKHKVDKKVITTDKDAHEALDKILDMLKKKVLNEFDISTKYNGYNVDIKITNQKE